VIPFGLYGTLSQVIRAVSRCAGPVHTSPLCECSTQDHRQVWSKYTRKPAISSKGPKALERLIDVVPVCALVNVVGVHALDRPVLLQHVSDCHFYWSSAVARSSLKDHD